MDKGVPVGTDTGRESPLSPRPLKKFKTNRKVPDRPGSTGATSGSMTPNRSRRSGGPYAAARLRKSCSRMNWFACLARSAPSVHRFRQMARSLDRPRATTAEEKLSKVIGPA